MDRPMIGKKLGNRYEIQELIGEGATAAVYRGLDTRLQRTVAIKVMLPYVDGTTRQRFQREAFAAARLNHPNIMAIYDVGEDDERPYLVIEYIEGKPLYSFIPSPPGVVAEFGRQICLALDYAHRQNLIHRDIKPANIHITPAGQVKLMDFGLAISGDTKRLTAMGRIIGTPAYLSPEQAQGLPLDGRTDIYSTGIVLYELAAGVLPFDADDIGVLLLQQVKKTPKPPSELVAGLPVSLEQALLKALAKKPEDRFESAGEMAAALGAVVAEANRTMSHHPVDVDRLPANGGAPRPAAAPCDRAIRVVLADDHHILRMTLAVYLNATECIEVVGEAEDGDQALALVREHHPDVLLLDLNMPGRGGLDVLPELRASWPEVRVLVLTGRDEDAYIVRALRAGAHGYVLKTTNEDDLVRAVQEVAEGHVVLGRGVAERVVQGLVSRAAPEGEVLSDLDRALLTGIAAGRTDAQIAERLRLSVELVERQISTLIQQLGASSRLDASLIALRRGLILLEDLRDA